VNLAGRNPATGESKEARYMTLRRLQEREGTLVQVRQFLWDEIGLKVYDYYLCKSHIITYISHVLLLHSRIITSLLLLMFKGTVSLDS
jgi:hypothetical protein